MLRTGGQRRLDVFTQKGSPSVFGRENRPRYGGEKKTVVGGGIPGQFQVRQLPRGAKRFWKIA